MSTKLFIFVAFFKSALFKQRLHFSVPYSLVIENLCFLLYQEGLILSFKIVQRDQDKRILIFLRSFGGQSSLKNIVVLFKPSSAQYVSYNDLAQLRHKRTVLVVSTNKGFLTGEGCLQNKVGGTVLVACF